MNRLVEALVLIAIGGVIIITNIELGVSGPVAVAAISGCTFCLAAAFELLMRLLENGGHTK